MPPIGTIFPVVFFKKYYICPQLNLSVQFPFRLVVTESPACFKPYSSAPCVQRSPQTDLDATNVGPGPLGRHGKPAVGLAAALSMEVFGLGSANKEYNPPKSKSTC